MGAKVVNNLRRKPNGEIEVSTTADMLELQLEKRQHVKRLQKELERADNPEDGKDKATRNAFQELMEHRTKLAARSSRHQKASASVSPNLLA